MYTIQTLPFFFFLSSTTLCEFRLAQLFLSMISLPVPSVSNYLLPSSSNRLSRHHPILILAFLSVLLHVISIYKCFLTTLSSGMLSTCPNPTAPPKFAYYNKSCSGTLLCGKSTLTKQLSVGFDVIKTSHQFPGYFNYLSNN